MGKIKHFSKRLTRGNRARARHNFLFADAHPARAVPLKNAQQKQPTPQKAACSGLPLHISSIPAPQQIQIVPLLADTHTHARTHAALGFLSERAAGPPPCSGAVSLRLQAPVEAPSPAERSHPHPPSGPTDRTGARTVMRSSRGGRRVGHDAGLPVPML